MTKPVGTIVVIRRSLPSAVGYAPCFQLFDDPLEGFFERLAVLAKLTRQKTERSGSSRRVRLFVFTFSFRKDFACSWFFSTRKARNCRFDERPLLLCVIGKVSRSEAPPRSTYGHTNNNSKIGQTFFYTSCKLLI